MLKSAAPAAEFDFIESGKAQPNDLDGVQVLLGNLPPAMLKNAQDLKFVQLNSAGSDEYAKGVLPEGVLLANATGGYGLAISEYIMAVLMSLNNKLFLYRDNQCKSLWKNEGEVRSIWNSTVLIVGLGDIGSEFAKRAKDLGATVLAVRRTEGVKPDYVDELYTSEQLDSLIPKADTIVLALPNTPATQRLMNRERIALMKRDSVLINVGRGNAVDGDALCDALNENRLWGAALDVTDPEPLPQDSPLWKAKNLILTPHVSGLRSLPETQERVIGLMAANLSAYINEKPIKNLVDPETGYRKKED